jgi:hypothetical protein
MSPTLRRHIGVLATALITASSLSAQSEAAPWPIGSRVRIWTDTASTVIGQLIDVRGDTLIVDDKPHEFCPVDCGDPTPNYGRLTLIGAGLGALIGAARRVDDWREVRTPARPIIAPSSRGATIGISFSFR